jgi:hypothetical protein
LHVEVLEPLEGCLVADHVASHCVREQENVPW